MMDETRAVPLASRADPVWPLVAAQPAYASSWWFPFHLLTDEACWHGILVATWAGSNLLEPHTMSPFEVLVIIVLLLAAGYAAVLQKKLVRANDEHAQLELARHIELRDAIAALGNNLELSEHRQQQRNLEQFTTALHDVIADINQRIVAGFERQLESLAAIANRSAQVADRQRSEQMEAMHHARRLADRMDNAVQDFGRLIADNAEWVALAGQVRETLALMASRQAALDAGMARQAGTVEAMIDAVGDLRTTFEQTVENLLQQVRRSLDALAQRQAQGHAALQKDVSDSVAKAMVSMNKQLSSMGPITQQARFQTFR